MNSFEIGPYAFKNCLNLKQVIIPEGHEITKIHIEAFENCPLESINIKSATFIGSRAFRNTNLQRVVLGRVTLEDQVFAYCQSLIEVEIQEDALIASISTGRFSDPVPAIEFFTECDSLETVDLGHLTKTCYRMFANCYSLKTIKSSNPELSIVNEAFYGCISLTDITPNVGVIGENAFMFCTSLTDLDTTNINKIGTRAFYGCEKLTNIHPYALGDDYAFAFCNSLVSCNVQSYAKVGLFMNCTKLESVTIEGIDYIPDKMFVGCTSLKTVVFPQSITAIGHYAFIDTKLVIPDLDLSDIVEFGNYSLIDTKIEKIKLGKDYIYYREDCDRRYVSVCPGVKKTDYSPLKGVSSIKEILIGAEKKEFEAVDFQECNDLNIRLEEGSPFQIVDGMLVKDNEIFYYRVSKGVFSTNLNTANRNKQVTYI
ncbi:surface antigen BspA-like [Trichomonas vaginalis G3]|uniref:Surface antigen BspA-like n=1 Tax=Trichomonas vaginalis (strain ATCC PRA-98 / G3) TaxID=412133 RepID=A2GL57_TRIV3|nr:surface antigen BspA-like [Trichomonas vaginalis G3]|eukprot:XP_001295040.1 surface antigen BspA-like [Trichomonas vaginalis G3]